MRTCGRCGYPVDEHIQPLVALGISARECDLVLTEVNASGRRVEVDPARVGVQRTAANGRAWVNPARL